MRNLTEQEAVRLQIYFEEEGVYNHRKRKEMEAQTASSSGNSPHRESVEVVFGDDDEEEYEDE